MVVEGSSFCAFLVNGFSYCGELVSTDTNNTHKRELLLFIVAFLAALYFLLWDHLFESKMDIIVVFRTSLISK